VLIARFLQYSAETYGGAPLILLINLIQASLLAWVLAQAWRAAQERALPPEVRRLRGAQRAELWQKQVRPLALGMMLLGPGLGLGMSTLLGALGMGS
jgi:hypothetical protein